MARIDRDRAAAMIGVGLLHALLGYAFLTGLALDVVRGAGRSLRVFEIVEPPPPPSPMEEPEPAKERAPEPEGAAAPPNLKARPTPVVAPPPKVKLEVPTPVLAAPEKTPLPPGPDPSAGNADRAGPGWGAGGQGVGTGSGASGWGSGGGGGLARRAQRIRGELRGSDYPRDLERAGVGGAVDVRFTVLPNGRVDDCVVLKSSGIAELDTRTCRLIQRRFLFRPAADASGRPVAETIVVTYDWWVARD